MTDYPVHFHCTKTDRYARLQLALRILAVLVLGAAGFSLGGFYGLLYFGLPVVAAIRISALATRSDYARSDAERILFFLRWAMAITSWVGLAAERLPARDPDETISLRVQLEGNRGPAVELPPGAAGLRILTGLPSLFVLLLLSLPGALVWLWAAVCILFSEQVPESAERFLQGLQRYAARLLVYQAGLVDTYPPFGLSDSQSRPPAGPTNLASDGELG